MELKRIWEIIWRRKWIIIQAFLVVFLTAIVGSFFVTPSYETSAMVLAKSSATSSSLLSSIGVTTGAASSSSSSTLAIETYLELASVEPILQKTITKLQLRDKDGALIKPKDLIKYNFITTPLFPAPYVKIEQAETDTDLIEITAGSTNTKEAEMIANTVAEAFMEQNLQLKREEFRKAQEFIEDKIKKIQADYFNALEGIRNYKIQEKTVDLDTETKTDIATMATLIKEKQDTVIKISEDRAKIQSLQYQLGKQNEITTSSTAVSENPQIENLKKMLTDLEVELAKTLIEKTQFHPDVVALTQKIKLVKEELKKEVDFFRESSKDLESLKEDLAAMEAHLKDINRHIDAHGVQLYTIPGKSFIQSHLEVTYDVNKTLYSNLLQYLYQLGVAEAITLSDIKLVQPATAPDSDKPTSPNKVLIGILGIFLGTIFGFSLGFLVDYLDDTIKNPQEAKALGQLFLGVIPKSSKKEGIIISKRDARDPVCEAYRTVRNSIKFACLDKPLHSLLVSSSIQGEGKSTAVVNLGISFALDGRKVLLIDTDLRNPSIHEIFGETNSMGITDILAGEAIPGDAIKASGIEGLSLLTSGPVPPDPGRMVESATMRDLIKDLAQQYDFIILDSPPILLVNDAIVLAGYVDSVSLVLESGKVTRRSFSQVIDLLQQANIQSCGVILNKFKRRKRGYPYGYYYNYKQSSNKKTVEKK